MRPSEGHFQPNVIMTDKELAQLIFAFRIFDHDVDISVSTRENAKFRDTIATLGATSISAGSKTDPGGYATYPQALEQFSVSDERTPAEVEQAVKAMGYEVVWKALGQNIRSMNERYIQPTLIPGNRGSRTGKIEEC